MDSRLTKILSRGILAFSSWLFFVNRKLTRTFLYFNILKQTLWRLPLTHQRVGNTCRVICSSNTSLRDDFWKFLTPPALKDNACVKHTSDLVLTTISFLFFSLHLKFHANTFKFLNQPLQIFFLNIWSLSFWLLFF
jgi:hypothetical protein